MSITEETISAKRTNGLQDLESASFALDLSGGAMRTDKFAGLGLTFDDVLFLPAASDVVPAQCRYQYHDCPRDRSERADSFLGHGYGDRSAPGNRAGA